MDNLFEFFTGLNLPQLEAYFENGQEESERIEFKSGESALNKLYKEACAFANTDGGIIIYGAPKEINEEVPNKKERRKVCKGPLNPSKEDKTPDTLIQILMAAVTPAIQGIKINRISHHDGFIYIIYIPQSIYSPHQVEGTYYMRAGTMSMPAPHGFVQAMFNKKKPIDLDFALSLFKHPTPDSPLRDVRVSITNKSDYPAHGVEGLIVMIRKIREKPSKEMRLVSEYLKDSRTRLTQSFTFPNSLVANLWCWYYFTDIYILEEPFYADVYVWAKDTPAIHKKYIVSTSLVRQLDPSNDTTELEQMKLWATPLGD